MRYLVTGGLGYAGSWAARHLARAGHTVFVLSRNTETPDIGAPYTLIQADLTADSPEQLAQRLPEALDGCIHAASYNEHFHDDYAHTALRVNALGTRNLLASLVLQAKNTHTMQPLPLVVYCSTFHVYGKSSGKVDETTPPAPLNDYALTHLFAEQYCHFFMRTAGLPCIIVRMTNCYGAPVCQPFSKWYLVINDLCRQAVCEGRLTIRANPAIQRDFIWLGDVSRSFELLLLRRDLTGQTFNFAQESPTSLKDIAYAVSATAEKCLGKPVPITFETTETPVPTLTVETKNVCKNLGLRFTNHLEEEIAETIRVILNSPTEPSL